MSDLADMDAAHVATPHPGPAPHASGAETRIQLAATLRRCVLTLVFAEAIANLADDGVGPAELRWMLDQELRRIGQSTLAT